LEAFRRGFAAVNQEFDSPSRGAEEEKVGVMPYEFAWLESGSGAGASSTTRSGLDFAHPREVFPRFNVRALTERPVLARLLLGSRVPRMECLAD
jgi:hypothetical protein